MMRQEWEPEDLVGAWTLMEDDWRRIANKRGATRLGFAVLLKFFEIEARFPDGPDEVPDEVVAYLADQVKVPAAVFARYGWDSRAIKYHRAQIREAFGFREATRDDEAALTVWLGEKVAPAETSERALVEALAARCRAERIEPPGRVDRIVAGARAMATTALCAQTVARLPVVVAERLDALADTKAASGAGGPELLAEIKAAPAQVGLETFLAEVDKLGRVRALGVPVDLFDGTSDTVVDAWRARAATEYPSDLASHPREVRLTLLAALCHRRVTEITDSLVDLLIALVHKIDTRAERRVEARCWPTCAGCGASRRFCSVWPRPPWSIPTTPSATPCTRWSARPPWPSWSRRPRRTRTRSGPGCVPCCARRTRRITGACCPTARGVAVAV